MKASCQTYLPGNLKFPLYRVYVPIGEWGEVYVFYLIDNKKRKFFWYKLPDSRERVAISIAEALKKFKETEQSVTIQNY